MGCECGRERPCQCGREPDEQPDARALAERIMEAAFVDKDRVTGARKIVGFERGRIEGVIRPAIAAVRAEAFLAVWDAFGIPSPSPDLLNPAALRVFLDEAVRIGEGEVRAEFASALSASEQQREALREQLAASERALEEVLQRIESSHRGSIGSIGNTYLPQIGVEEVGRWRARSAAPPKPDGGRP